MGAQRFDSDLLLSQLRFGLNYPFNGDNSQSADKDVSPLIVDPAYNSDRGPASVAAARLHAQF